MFKIYLTDNTFCMVTTIVRCFIIYFIALFVLRVMGKRQIGQMQPFELVITLIIADLATVPMADSKIPLLNGIVPLLTLCVIHFLITIISLLSNKFNKFINGNAIIVIDKNGIVEKNLKKLYMNVEDLIELCRNAGYFNLDDILYAIVETSGMVSVLPKSKATPITRDDMEIKKSEGSVGVVLISEGKIVTESEKQLNISKEKLKNFLSSKGIKSEKEVSALVVYDDEVYLKKWNKKVNYFKNIMLSEGV